GAPDLPECLPHRLPQGWAVAQRAPNEVSDDLRVGVALELHSVGFELPLELEVVLDDAVVHHRDAVDLVRVGVRLRGAPVGRPARVPEPHATGQLTSLDGLGEVVELAHGARDAQALPVVDDDARGVVPAVLEPLETVEQHGGDPTLTDVANDSAHGDLGCRATPGAPQASRRRSFR